MFEIVVATEAGIGIDNHLPWKDRADLKKFKLWHPHVDPVKWTQSWEKHGRIPVKPLPGRKNIVVTRSTKSTRRYLYSRAYKTLSCMLSRQRYRPNFVIGGARMLRSIAPSRLSHRTQSTVDSDVPCDTFFRMDECLELDYEIFTWGRYLTARLPFGLRDRSKDRYIHTLYNDSRIPLEVRLPRVRVRVEL
jgi:dihydrofolate reductase